MIGERHTRNSDKYKKAHKICNEKKKRLIIGVSFKYKEWVLLGQLSKQKNE